MSITCLEIIYVKISDNNGVWILHDWKKGYFEFHPILACFAHKGCISYSYIEGYLTAFQIDSLGAMVSSIYFNYL